MKLYNMTEPKIAKFKVELKVLEQYCRLKDYPNYAVSNYGKVLNIKTQRFLKLSQNRDGYLQVSLYKGACRVHALVANAFLPHSDPNHVIDHIDRNRTNNMVTNLRWVTPTENRFNRSKTERQCSSHYVGVVKKGKRWVAQIVVDSKSTHIGCYETELEACQAYNKTILEKKLPNRPNDI